MFAVWGETGLGRLGGWPGNGLKERSGALPGNESGVLEPEYGVGEGEVA